MTQLPLVPAGGNIALSYDAASRITGRTETGFAAESFGYDALDRLATYANGAATQTYTYDANGNRAGYFDNATPPVSLTYNIDPASNRLAGIAGSWAGSFTYDAAGNMLSYSTPFAGYSFSYDARNRQTQAFVGAIGTGFLINGLGQRIAQMNGSVAQFFFVYDEAGHLTGKYDGGGNPRWETAWLGDLPVAVLEPAGNFYIAPDHLGSPHQITDSSGAVVWRWHPDPFGNGDPTGAFTYALRFPGQYFDLGTKLHYNYFRDYDPRTGRYIESDPLGLEGGINTYAYVRNNPVNYRDPLGLFDAGGGLSGLIGRIIDNLLPGQSESYYADPPSDAYDQTGAKAPGKPGPEEGFEDPEEGDNWVPNPNGPGSGWEDKKGNVWCPTGPGRAPHGGPHWDVQTPGGGHINVYPGGRRR